MTKMTKPVYILAVAKIAPRVIFYMAASMAGAIEGKMYIIC